MYRDAIQWQRTRAKKRLIVSSESCIGVHAASGSMDGETDSEGSLDEPHRDPWESASRFVPVGGRKFFLASFVNRVPLASL